MTANRATLAMEMETLYPRCLGWALACCRNRREDAEDLLQDVYLGVLDNGLRFHGRSSLRTWLFGVIRHKARARLRRDRLRALLGVARAARIDGPAVPALPDDDAVAADRRQRTRDALGKLSPRQRQVLTLVFYKDLTIEEAARAMEVSIGSARIHYHRGKQRLARLLAIAAVLVAVLVVAGIAERVAATRVPRLDIPKEVLALSAWHPATDALLDTPATSLLLNAPRLGASMIAIPNAGELR